MRRKEAGLAEYHTVRAETLEALAARIFEKLGAPADVATEVAAHLVRANLAGHDSHGVLRIPQYALSIERGTLQPAARPTLLRQHGATLLVDAAWGFGQFATAYALERAIECVPNTGVAAAAMRRANHVGRVGDYTESAAHRGYVALVTVGAAGPGIGGATPFGGAGRFLGTNPWSIGIPTAGTPTDRGEPVLVDFASTVVAEGKVHVARAMHQALSPGCIVDKDGRPSTDPEDYYAGGMLLPAGGHKGYGLALAAALLGGLAAIGETDPSMAGAAAHPSERSAGDRLGGVLLVVIDPAAFGDATSYAASTGRVTRALKRVRPAPGVDEVLLPGEPEARAQAQRRQDGISLPEDTWQAIARVAAPLHVEMPHE